MSGIDARLDALLQSITTSPDVRRPRRFRDRRRPPMHALPHREFDVFLAAFWSGYLTLLAGVVWWLLA